MSEPLIMTQVGIRPFQVPAEVQQVVAPRLKQEGLQFVPTFKLSELPVETLLALCDQFKRDVFKAAGKEIPNGK